MRFCHELSVCCGSRPPELLMSEVGEEEEDELLALPSMMQGGDIEGDNSMPFGLPWVKRNPEVVQLLINFQSNLEVRDPETGATVLHILAQSQDKHDVNQRSCARCCC